MRTPPRTPLAATTALVILAASSACAPRPVLCSPQSERFDGSRGFTGENGFTRENRAPVHPAMAATAVAVTAACVLAGHRYN